MPVLVMTFFFGGGGGGGGAKTSAKMLWPPPPKRRRGRHVFSKKPGGYTQTPETLCFGAELCNFIAEGDLTIRDLEISLVWTVFCQVVCNYMF